MAVLVGVASQPVRFDEAVYSPTSSSLSPTYHMRRNPILSNPVPNKSLNDVRKGMAILSGS